MCYRAWHDRKLSMHLFWRAASMWVCWRGNGWRTYSNILAVKNEVVLDSYLPYISMELMMAWYYYPFWDYCFSLSHTHAFRFITVGTSWSTHTHIYIYIWSELIYPVWLNQLPSSSVMVSYCFCSNSHGDEFSDRSSTIQSQGRRGFCLQGRKDPRFLSEQKLFFFFF